MAARRVFLTGAGGFVGAVLARRLIADGHDVTLAVRPGSDSWRLEELGEQAAVVALDLRDAEAVERVLRRARPERVFSLHAHGAYSWQRSMPEMIDVNFRWTVNLLDAALALDVEAFVHAGSSSEYGYVDHAPSEDELPEPNSPYAVTKCAATLHCGWAARERGAAATVLRLYSAYGPFEDPRRLLPTLVAACLRGELPPLADPSIARDFVFVDDVADAFVRAADRARPGDGAVYNIGSGAQTTLGELVALARAELGVEAEPVWGDYDARDWDTSVWVADPGRAAAELGWHAERTLAEGLRALAAWSTGAGEQRMRTAVARQSAEVNR